MHIAALSAHSPGRSFEMAAADAGQPRVAEVAGDNVAAVDAGQLPVAQAAGDNVAAVDAGQLPVAEAAGDNAAAMDAGQLPAADSAVAAGVAHPSSDGIRKALALLLLDGDELEKVSIGSLRKMVAQSLGLPADG